MAQDAGTALTSAGPAAAIGERLDRLPVTGLHVAAVVVATLGLFADIAEVALSNALAAVFLAPPHSVPSGELALLLASVFAGGAIGAPLFGMLADRYGRRIALQAALVLIFGSSVAAAASPDVQTMTAFRFISGLAIGAYPPLTAAYLSDILPPKRRGTLMLVCAALAFLGAPAIIFLIRTLEPIAPLGIEAWRWSLALGGLVALASAGLFALVPESPRWLAAAGRLAAADEACRRLERAAGIETASIDITRESAGTAAPRIGFRALFASAGDRRRVLLVAALYGLGPWASIGFPLLSAAVLVTLGFSLRDSLLFAAVTMFGPTAGNLLMAGFIDRMDRRVALLLCVAAMLAVGLVFALGSTLGVLIAAGILFNLASAVYSASLAVYAAELFPTGFRASATAGAWAIGRAVSALVPIILLPLLTSVGALAMFGVIAAALVASAALLMRGPPGLTRQPLH